MKISKLFHWLYAVLMLLPVLYIGTRCLYTIFNKNAKDSYSGDTTYEINYKYQSNEVNSEEDLVEGNIYTFTLNGTLSTDVNLLRCTYIKGQRGDGLLELDVSAYQNSFFLVSYIAGTDTYRATLMLNGSATTLVYGFGKPSFDFVNYNFVNTDYIQNISICNYNEIESVDIDNTGTLDNAFIYSVNQLNEVPLFAWAKDSFLVTPFTYITGLFGVPSSSPINTMLSYWLDISIIWLVFDLVMYVPLLVHRWLDKGVLE